MKILLLLSLAALSSAQTTPAPTAWECITGEFLADGYTTGQNIELNYQGTQMGLDANGNTEITVGFLVPKVYSEQYMASMMTISFNRDTPQSNPGVDAVIGQEVGTTDGACFTNNLGNQTECSQGANAAVWSNAGAQGDSPCVDFMYMTTSWTDAITNKQFGNVQFVDDGTSTRVYMMATVETWRKFDQSTSADYLGQMTGSQQKNFNAVDDSGTRTGTYFGDGGDLDVDFPALTMNDWRYTLYQIPFYMKFPKTVVVENEFTIGSPIAVLNGVVQQDVIQVNLNPGNPGAQYPHGPQFAVLDVVVTTEVQYPYAIRGPTDALAQMRAVIGSTNAGGAGHAENIDFVKWDAPENCAGNVEGQICQQSFTMRITPKQTSPCSVAGDYFMEFWAKCVTNVHGCGIGTNVEQTNNLPVQRNSQAYFSLKFTVAHQDFCPEVVDTVHVAVDLQAYHDEAFTVPISNNYNGNPTAYNANTNVVYTNDIIYYEATYRTGSVKSGAANQVVGTNNAGAPGGPGSTGQPNIIDYVRAVKIYTDVYLGLSAPNTPTGTWDTAGWKENLIWTLGGSRVPGPGEDFDDAALTVSGARVVQVPAAQPSNSAHWRMIECEVAYIDPAVPIVTGSKPLDCFTSSTDIALDYMDFEQVVDNPAIKENEVAWKMRLDERVFPIRPETDNSYITVTLESEVYYIGNQHPTRRLLQVGAAPALQKQRHVKTLQHSVHYKANTLTTCQHDADLGTTTMVMTLDFSADSSKAPQLDSVNDWALNLAAKLEKHMDVQNSIKITEVEKCNASGCSVILDEVVTPTRRRRMMGPDLVHVTVEVGGTEFATAGKLVNSLQVEIATRKFTVADSEITHLDSPDCNTVATSTKLASSSAALGLLIPALAAILALF